MSDFQMVGFVARGAKYMATYRFTEDEPFFILTPDNNETPILFETSLEAIRAAKERISQQRKVIEPKKEESPPEDILGLSEWRQQKAKQLAETKITVRTGQLCPVKVEYRKRKNNK